MSKANSKRNLIISIILLLVFFTIILTILVRNPNRGVVLDDKNQNIDTSQENSKIDVEVTYTSKELANGCFELEITVNLTNNTNSKLCGINSTASFTQGADFDITSVTSSNVAVNSNFSNNASLLAGPTTLNAGETKTVVVKGILCPPINFNFDAFANGNVCASGSTTGGSNSGGSGSNSGSTGATNGGNTGGSGTSGTNGGGSNTTGTSGVGTGSSTGSSSTGGSGSGSTTIGSTGSSSGSTTSTTGSSTTGFTDGGSGTVLVSGEDGITIVVSSSGTGTGSATGGSSGSGSGTTGGGTGTLVRTGFDIFNPMIVGGIFTAASLLIALSGKMFRITKKKD